MNATTRALLLLFPALALAGPDAGRAPPPKAKSVPKGKRQDDQDHSGRAVPYIDRTERLCRAWSRPEEAMPEGCGPHAHYVCVVDQYEGPGTLPVGGWGCEDNDVPSSIRR